MLIDRILQGESNNVEFKEMLPQNSEKYTKTVVAFANTQGGYLVFGVADKNREIVGIDGGILFHAMDSIANAVSDSCEPQIIPSIEPYTIDGKTIIIVTIMPGHHRPYYLKSKGKENGVYVRVGGTTRLAGEDKIQDLKMEGSKISWDEIICVGYMVMEKAIKKLCRDMNRYRKEMQERKNLIQKLSAVTRVNLENWNLLKKTNGGYQASNAFVLLTSNYFPFSKTQCAVFKGKDRAVFLDKREYTGPIYEQIDEAYKFVLRNIRLGARVEGIQRKEAYELPEDAIREMIVNAHCHRNMRDESCVQVAIYDDRLEVTSPGGLYNGLTFEEALQGHSKLRNRIIANVLSQIGFVEAWGTGIQRIRRAAREYGLPEPEFIELPESFRVNLFRSLSTAESSQSNSNRLTYVRETAVNDRVMSEINVGIAKNIGNVSEINRGISQNVGEMSEINTEISENVGEKSVHVGAAKKKMLKIIADNNKISAKEIAKIMSVTSRTVERYIQEFKQEGKLIRHGSARGGHWEVIQ